MMDITMTEAGKRFRTDWIFRDLNCQFKHGERYAILGPNGSGKSTLMKTLSGHSSLTKGRIVFESGQKMIEPDHVFRYISYAAPYIELIEEFTLEETLTFHTRLQKMQDGLSDTDLLTLIDLPKSRHKEVRFFSSGMKQRVKLALAICAATPVLLLDEPTTNLDATATAWFHELLRTQVGSERLVFIASNDPADVALCTEQLQIMDYKMKR